MDFKLTSLLNIIVLLFLCTSSLALEDVGSVLKVEGSVSKLYPNAIRENTVENGDKLFQNTIFTTKKSSYAILLFKNSVKVVIGPKSVVSIAQTNSHGGIVLSLLSGKLRGGIPQNKFSKKVENFYVVTETGIANIKGEDAQIIYNPKNTITNILSFKGEVDFAKVYNLEKEKKSLRFQRDSKGKVQIIEDKYDLPVTTYKNIDSAFSKRFFTVRNGQFSAVSQFAPSVTAPVKISHVQLGILFQNKNLDDSFSYKSISLQKDVKSYAQLDQSDQKYPNDGYKNLQETIYSPKSGGFIDLKSGFYIQPEADAKYDEYLKNFIPNSVGLIDLITGQYAPPQGLYLHSKKGFVLRKSKKMSEEQKKELLRSKKTLNAEIDNEYFLQKEYDLRNWKILSQREIFTKNSLALEFSSFSQSSKVLENSVENDELLEMSGLFDLDVKWTIAGNANYESFLSLGMQIYDYSENLSYSKSADVLYRLGFGFNKVLLSRLSFLTNLTIDQVLIPSYGDVEVIPSTLAGRNDIKEFEIVSLTKVISGFNLKFIKSGRFFWDVSFFGVYNLSRQAANIDVSSSLGHKFTSKLGYWLKRDQLITLGYKKSSSSREISSDLFSANFETETSGLSLGLSIFF